MQKSHPSLPLAALGIFSTTVIQSALWRDGVVCFDTLPTEALEIFYKSCVQHTMRHQQGRDAAYCLPRTALGVFDRSALQHYLRSTGAYAAAISTAALDMFHGSQIQRSVEVDRVSSLTVLSNPSSATAAVSLHDV